MDIETDELLQLLSDRVKAEMARTTIEEQRAAELRWLFKQQEYLLAAVREYFEELAERITGLEELILSSDHRLASLRRQLAGNVKTLSALEEERAQRAGEINVALDNRIESLRAEIIGIESEIEDIDTKTP